MFDKTIFGKILLVCESACCRQTDQNNLYCTSFFYLYLSQTINNIQFDLFLNILVYDLFYLIIERCDITWIRPLTFSQEVIYKRSHLVQQNFICVRFWALKCPYTQFEFLFLSVYPCAVCCVPFFACSPDVDCSSYMDFLALYTKPVGRTISSVWQTRTLCCSFAGVIGVVFSR